MTLKAINLNKSYNRRKVVNNVSLKVERGQIIGLFGPNGAGKTTCFSILAGLVKSDSGQLFVGDSEITTLPIYKRSSYGLGYLPQESSIFRGLSVEDNILAMLELVEKNKENRNKIIEKLLGDFGVSHLKNADSFSLSGGERRRVEIARALVTNPKYILLDEPLAGIDPIAINDIKNLILKLKEMNIGILVTDHNIREMLDVVDRAYIMFEGKILFEGNAKETAKSDLVKKVYLGEGFSYLDNDSTY
jgi:lipopolysaccharide export system ATP-binding protein